MELPQAAVDLGMSARRRLRAGQGLVEYGLILALTLVLTVLILGVLGGTLADVLAAIGNAIDSATGGSLRRGESSAHRQEDHWPTVRGSRGSV